jgi:hypothetical protein
MTAYAGEKPILLIKKLGGLVLVILGCLLAATGYNTGGTALGIIGIGLLAGGLLLLVLKIVRRNQSAHF